MIIYNIFCSLGLGNTLNDIISCYRYFKYRKKYNRYLSLTQWRRGARSEPARLRQLVSACLGSFPNVRARALTHTQFCVCVYMAVRGAITNMAQIHNYTYAHTQVCVYSRLVTSD